MVRLRPPRARTFGKPLDAFDIYSAGIACHAVPVAFIPVIVGALHELQYPHVWSGDDPDVDLALTQINDFIGKWGTADTLCTPGDSETGDTGKNIVYVCESVGRDCEDCEMASCSIPYGALRMSEGVLQYRYCGEWYDVDGWVVGDDLPDTPDEPPVEPPPEYHVATACDRALAFTDVVFAIVDKAMDYALEIASPFAFENAIKAQYPNITFGRSALWNVWAGAQSVGLLGLGSVVEDPDVQQRMICAVESVVDAGWQGYTEGEYKAASDAIIGVAVGAFTPVAHPTEYSTMRGMYDYACRAIGKGDANKITALTTEQTGRDCACPGEPEVPTTDPITGGWYLGQSIKIGVLEADDDRYNQPEGVLAHCWDASKHIYGIAIEYAVVNGVAMKEFSINGVQGLCTPDVDLTEYRVSNDYTTTSRVIFVFDATIAADLYAEWGTSRLASYNSAIGNWSDVVNVPAALQGQNAGVGVEGYANSGQTVVADVWAYPIYNANDETH